MFSDHLCFNKLYILQMLEIILRCVLLIYLGQDAINPATFSMLSKKLVLTFFIFVTLCFSSTELMNLYLLYI